MKVTGNECLAGTWNSVICDAMAPKEGDIVAEGEKGLDAFSNMNLEENLVAKGIDTIALGGEGGSSPSAALSPPLVQIAPTAML